MFRLKEKYDNEIAKQIKESLGIENVMEVPKLQKIVVNMGLGEAVGNSKIIESAVADLESITAQKPVVTKAKKSIAGFKLREGVAIGVKVTLRGQKMWAFLDRLISFALPRVRDFKGISNKAFDGRGNYTLGIKEQIIFPEINYDTISGVRGMNITLVTSAKKDEHASALLKALGMPFRK